MKLKFDLSAIRARLRLPRAEALRGLTGRVRALTEKLAEQLAESWRLAETGTLALRLPAGWPEAEAAIAWWWRPAQGAAESGTVARLEELPEHVRKGLIQVWTPAGDTLFTNAALPTRSRARILQALPYALEEQLLDDPEGLDFSYRPQPDGRLAVAVTARARLASWVQALKAAGLTPALFCPATLAPALEEGAWTLAADGADGYVRSGELSGFACPLPWDAPPAVLAVALREAQALSRAPRELVVWNPPAGFDRDGWVTALGLPVTVRAGSSWDTAPAAPFNLLQGELAPAGELRQLLQPLRPAAAMLALALAAAFALNLVEWGRLSYVQAQQRREMTELFTRSFPEAKTVVDPVLQMERNLAVLQANSGKLAVSDLLPLLARVVPAVQGIPQLKLRAMQYGEATLTLDVTVIDFRLMELLKNSLQGRGLRVDVVSANSRGSGVEARLRLKLGGRA
jgi:general secretion pathway protein L